MQSRALVVIAAAALLIAVIFGGVAAISQFDFPPGHVGAQQSAAPASTLDSGETVSGCTPLEPEQGGAPQSCARP